MIGLEYILNLYNVQHQELAEKLGIKKQNINLWIKGKQKVSKKHLPTLSEMFGIEEEYFQKEIDEIDKLVIQKEKLKRELKPEIIGYDMQLIIGENADIVQKPIYNTDIINDIEFEIEKTKVIEDMRSVISHVDDDFNLKIIEQIALLLQENGDDTMFWYTIDAISHYYDVLPDWVSEPGQEEFVEEFIELAKKYDK
ncbi:helix-turn-helix domain-containing protein [Anaerophilus nitritogenes]|uniref:helix-turn-helix domain-containing protein n=1 Tax=Anaerophilus nitritogenes TaxID=2498136 RepID=UPI00101CE5DD|nr:helix-turn-helix transcriptional regulator [Anaerophilus nitritogenes]